MSVSIKVILIFICLAPMAISMPFCEGLEAAVTTQQSVFFPHDYVSNIQATFADAEKCRRQDKRPDLKSLHSAALSEALNHPATLLQFITNPNTTYPDRMAAVEQGASRIPLTQMPEVLKDRDEVFDKGNLCDWGYLPNPFAGQIYRINPPSPPNTLVVLGHTWQVPSQKSPYPMNWAEECKAPWLWQVQQALSELFLRMRPHDDASNHRWLNVLMTMPCENDADAYRFVEATKVIDPKNLAIMSRWRQIAENPSMPLAAAEIARYLGDIVTAWPDDRAQGLTQLVFLALFRRPEPKLDLLGNSALSSMREQRSGPTKKRLPVPASTVLEFCKLALDPAVGGETMRLCLFVFPICQTVDNPPPLIVNDQIDPASPDVEKDLKLFSVWFEQNRPGLEAAAKAEAPVLDQLRKDSDEAARKFEAATAPS